jgi:putative glutamine amidotransferase
MRIGLTLGRSASKNEKNDYIRALVNAGFRREEIEVLPPGSEPEGRYDGMVLGGGEDVDPARYGREPRPDANVEIDADRDSTEFAAFEKARREGVPVLGICRGMQLVNVALGGTLHQDIPSERPSDVTHEVPGQDPERRDHKVELKPGTRLSEIARASEIEVNSRHHQAVERLAPGIDVSALAPDGLIEAFESASPWLLAVQWHPENLLQDPVSRRLFADFARAARERAGEGILRPPDLLTPA